MQTGGCVLFSGAVMGQFPHALSLPYGTSKAAVHYLTKALVKEFADRGVRVNSVAPGFVETEWQKNKPQEIRRSIESKIALHRFAEPDEIARLAAEILENPYINGSIVNIDGGIAFNETYTEPGNPDGCGAGTVSGNPPASRQSQSILL